MQICLCYRCSLSTSFLADDNVCYTYWHLSCVAPQNSVSFIYASIATFTSSSSAGEKHQQGLQSLPRLYSPSIEALLIRTRCTSTPRVREVCMSTCLRSLECKESFINLSVILDEKVTFRDHIHDKINKAYSMLGIIKRNFKYLTISSFVLLYKSMVRSHLDYCSSIWVPYKKVTLSC